MAPRPASLTTARACAATQCYLWDTRFRNYNRTATRLVTIAGDTVPAFVNATHRKVAAYVFYADRVENDGHGTHTGASIVGSAAGFDPTRQPDLATGAATPAGAATGHIAHARRQAHPASASVCAA